VGTNNSTQITYKNIPGVWQQIKGNEYSHRYQTNHNKSPTCIKSQSPADAVDFRRLFLQIVKIKICGDLRNLREIK